MKCIVCYCLILCMTILSLSACAPQEPTADVHAIQIGATEKQVIEKAGYPDGYVGAEEDVYFYYTNEQQTQCKLLWFFEGKVCIIASMSGGMFTQWSVSPTYSFKSLAEVQNFSFWNGNMDPYDLISYLGFGYESVEYAGFGIMNTTYTYTMENESCLKVTFSAMQLKSAVFVNSNGEESVLWQTGVLKKDGTRVLE